MFSILLVEACIVRGYEVTAPVPSSCCSIITITSACTCNRTCSLNHNCSSRSANTPKCTSFILFLCLFSPVSNLYAYSLPIGWVVCLQRCKFECVNMTCFIVLLYIQICYSILLLIRVFWRILVIGLGCRPLQGISLFLWQLCLYEQTAVSLSRKHSLSSPLFIFFIIYADFLFTWDLSFGGIPIKIVLMVWENEWMNYLFMKCFVDLNVVVDTSSKRVSPKVWKSQLQKY